MNVWDATSAHPQQDLTKYELETMGETIESYRQKFHVYPRSMGDLAPMLTNQLGDFGPGGEFLDGWQRPFIFLDEGTNCVVISYGRDGKAGGNGLDYDLTSKNPNPKEARPTFKQFLYEMPTGGMIKSCLACGVLAALLAAFTVKVPDFSRQGVVSLAAKLGVTAICAVMVAVFISILHIPSGH
jgi:hypothetical protein